MAGWISCQPLRSSPRRWRCLLHVACSQGVMARVVLADVAGHGEAVSVAAGRLRECSSAARGALGPIRLDPSIERQLSRRSAEHTRFATAFLASFYSQYRRTAVYQCRARAAAVVSCGCAGVELSAGIDSAQQGGCRSSPGADCREPPTARRRYNWRREDLLLLYTDGVNEACDESGTQLGLERLLSIARSLPRESPVAAGKGCSRP